MGTRGKFITFEGGEGCGKTTQSKRVIKSLRDKNYKVINPREPGGTATGEMIRNILQLNASGEELCTKTEFLLFEAARAQLVNNVINPYLETGGIVVCDRFYDSTIAYQGYGRGMNLEMIERINNYVVQGCKPDLTLLLDGPAEVGLGRIVSRGEVKDTFEKESFDFHNRARAGYLRTAEKFPERVALIDATKDIEAVYSQIKAAFKEKVDLEI